MEAIPSNVVTDAVTDAIRLGAIGSDAIKQIALARVERHPARLDLTRLSASAKDPRADDIGGRLRRPRCRERGMSGTRKFCSAITLSN